MNFVTVQQPVIHIASVSGGGISATQLIAFHGEAGGYPLAVNEKLGKKISYKFIPKNIGRKFRWR